MTKKKKQLEEEKKQYKEQEESTFLKGQTIKDLIAPSGINAYNLNHLECKKLFCINTS